MVCLFKSGPELNETRSQHSCSILKYNNPESGFKERILVVGGGQDPSYKPLVSTELLHLDDYEAGIASGWMSGPSLPWIGSFLTMLESEDGVLHVGLNYDDEQGPIL